MKSKLVFFILGLIVPVIIYVITTLYYAHGDYDGKHCAGLLDAVWECNEAEYYFDFLFNIFVLIYLFYYLAISAIVTPILWFLYTKYKD